MGAINKGVDPLTGLLTKAEFLSQVTKKLASGEIAAGDVTCIYFDVKAFKLFYMRNGFDLAYDCLVSISETVRGEFKDELLCRSSNDHFIVIAKREDLRERIGRVQEAIHERWQHTGLELTAGTYELKAGETDMEAICSNAKMACKSAEASGNVFSSYDGELERSIRLRQHIMHHFSEALEKEYIKIYYQPILHVIAGCAVTRRFPGGMIPNTGFCFRRSFYRRLWRRGRSTGWTAI